MENIIGIWPNLFRAIEVAKVGGYSITVYANDDYTVAKDDFEVIRSFCKDFFTDFNDNGDLFIELHQPQYNTTRKAESLNDIEIRIASVLYNKEALKHNDSGSDALLRNAITKLGFSLSTIEKITKISITIAKMHGAPVVRPEHLAEAIHYSIFPSLNQTEKHDLKILSTKNEMIFELIKYLEERNYHFVRKDNGKSDIHPDFIIEQILNSFLKQYKQKKELK